MYPLEGDERPRLRSKSELRTWSGRYEEVVDRDGTRGGYLDEPPHVQAVFVFPLDAPGTVDETEILYIYGYREGNGSFSPVALPWWLFRLSVCLPELESETETL